MKPQNIILIIVGGLILFASSVPFFFYLYYTTDIFHEKEEIDFPGGDASGGIEVEFKHAINYSESVRIIEEYNLTVVPGRWLMNKEKDRTVCTVTVPVGKEKQYRDLLNEDPNVEKAYLIPIF